MPAIDIIDASGNDYRYNLPEDGSVLLIGTGDDCSISLPHIADLQPQHCTISLQEEGYVIAIATEGATLLAESQPVEAAVLVPRAVYHIGSAMLMYDEAETSLETPEAPEMPETPEAPEAAATDTTEQAEHPRKKKKKKAKQPAGNPPLVSTAIYTEEDSTLHIILRRLYVIAILATAFLAGLTMRYWMITGEFLIDELLK